MKQSTLKQRQAVRYCEKWLCIEFEANIDNFNECSAFLNMYLEDAKQTERELICEYSAYIWDLNND